MRYICKNCGQEFPSARILLAARCPRSKTYGNHELYEGGEKRVYTCKYCGQTFPSIKVMVCGPCPRNRDGHSPAL